MTGDAESCRVDAAPRASSAGVIAEIRSQLMAEGEAKDVVVLNGRGYNYGTPESSDPALLDFEAKQQTP
jgi:hypothetical protein